MKRQSIESLPLNGQMVCRPVGDGQIWLGVVELPKSVSAQEGDCFIFDFENDLGKTGWAKNSAVQILTPAFENKKEKMIQVGGDVRSILESNTWSGLAKPSHHIEIRLIEAFPEKNIWVAIGASREKAPSPTHRWIKIENGSSKLIDPPIDANGMAAGQILSAPIWPVGDFLFSMPNLLTDAREDVKKMHELTAMGPNLPSSIIESVKEIARSQNQVTGVFDEQYLEWLSFLKSKGALRFPLYNPVHQEEHYFIDQLCKVFFKPEKNNEPSPPTIPINWGTANPEKVASTALAKIPDVQKTTDQNSLEAMIVIHSALERDPGPKRPKWALDVLSSDRLWYWACSTDANRSILAAMAMRQQEWNFCHTILNYEDVLGSSSSKKTLVENMINLMISFKNRSGRTRQDWLTMEQENLMSRCFEVARATSDFKGKKIKELLGVVKAETVDQFKKMTAWLKKELTEKNMADFDLARDIIEGQAPSLLNQGPLEASMVIDDLVKLAETHPSAVYSKGAHPIKTILMTMNDRDGLSGPAAQKIIECYLDHGWADLNEMASWVKGWGRRETSAAKTIKEIAAT